MAPALVTILTILRYGALGSGVLLLVMSARHASMQALIAASENRSIPYEPHVPIASRLRPGDRLVTVTRQTGEHGALWNEEPTAEQELLFLAKVNDAALVVDTVDLAGFLLEDGAWIGTRIGAVIAEVLSGRAFPTRVGGHVVLTYIHGGELYIGQTLVRAGLPVRMNEGDRHFLFVQRDSATETLFPSRIMRVKNGRIVSPAKSGSSHPKDRLHGFELTRVRALLRSSQHH